MCWSGFGWQNLNSIANITICSLHFERLKHSVLSPRLLLLVVKEKAKWSSVATFWTLKSSFLDVTVSWETCHSTSNYAFPTKSCQRRNTSNHFTIPDTFYRPCKDDLHRVWIICSVLSSSCRSVLLFWNTTLHNVYIATICQSWGCTVLSIVVLYCKKNHCICKRQWWNVQQHLVL